MSLKQQQQKEEEEKEAVELFSYDPLSSIGPSHWGKIQIKGYPNQCDGRSHRIDNNETKSGGDFSYYGEQSGINIDTISSSSSNYTKCDEYYHPQEMFHAGNCTINYHDFIYTITKRHVVQVEFRNDNTGSNNKKNQNLHCIAPYIRQRSQSQQSRRTSSKSSSSSSMVDDQYNYYDFVQLHIHLGSEHSIDHHLYPAEIHIVHRLRKSKNHHQQQQHQHSTMPKELLVVGLFLDYQQRNDTNCHCRHLYHCVVGNQEIDPLLIMPLAW